MASLLRTGRTLRSSGVLRRSAWLASPAASTARSFSTGLRPASVLRNVAPRLTSRCAATEAAKAEPLGVAYNELTLGIPKEASPETRVSVTPASVQVPCNYMQ